MSKRIRFGVFKRDSFTCRYCGATAPNVQLQIDHVVPVSDGGTDDPDNLVTACAACNVGKGARPLDDDDASPLKDDGSVTMDLASDGGSRTHPDDPAGSALREGGVSDAATGFANRRQQAQAIEERRAQLEMMIEWREETVSLQDEAVDAIDRRIIARTGLSMSEECRQRMRRWVRHHGVPVIFDALEDALDQMLEWQDGVVTIASWERALAAIPQIIELRQVARDKPYFRELLYICGVLRRRLQYVNELRCLRLMEEGVEAGASIEAIKAFARTVKSWTAFRKGLEEFISDYGRPGHTLSARPSTGPPMPAGDAGRPTEPNAVEPADRTAPTEGRLAAERSAIPESPFERRRPLRHFSTEGSLNTVGLGDQRTMGSGTRQRPG